MSDDLKQVLRAEADRSDAMLLHMTAARMRAAADRIDDLEKELTDARALLQTAVDAWNCAPVGMCCAWRNVQLSLDWREQARKAVEHE